MVVEALLSIFAMFGVGVASMLGAIVLMPAPGDFVDSERLPGDW